MFDETKHPRDADGRFTGEKTAHVLIGAPASGKSTWRAAHLAQAARPTTVISSDDIIDQIAAERGQTYSQVFQGANHKAIGRKLLAQLHAATARGDDVVIDRTNMTAGSRAKFLSQLPEDYVRKAVVFHAPRDALNQRLRARAAATGKHIPRGIVKAMLASYEPPAEGEFHSVEHIGDQKGSVMNKSDDIREFAAKLSKLFGIKAGVSDQNTKPFGGVQVTPRAQLAIGRIAGLASSNHMVVGNAWARGNVIRQATRAVATGKISSHTASKRIDVSLARRAPTITRMAPGSMGAGGSGWSGAPASELGMPATAGSASVAAPVAAPYTPPPLNGR